MFFVFEVKAQSINGIKSLPIYQQGIKYVERFDREGKEIVRIEFDLIVSSKQSFRKLYPDWEYTIIGFGDKGVKDLDIKVYEYNTETDRWAFVCQDETSEPVSTLKVKPNVEKMYQIEIIVYEYYPGFTAAKYGLFIVHD